MRRGMIKSGKKDVVYVLTVGTKRKPTSYGYLVNQFGSLSPVMLNDSVEIQGLYYQMDYFYLQLSSRISTSLNFVWSCFSDFSSSKSFSITPTRTTYTFSNSSLEEAIREYDVLYLKITEV